MRFVHIEKDINLTLTNKVWIGHFLSDNKWIIKWICKDTPEIKNIVVKFVTLPLHNNQI